MTALDVAFRRLSPRINPKPVAPLGAAIMAAIALFWLVAFVSAFRSQGLAAWSVGVAFIVYDLGTLSSSASRRASCSPAPHRGRREAVTLAVIVAAYNEASALAATLDALFDGESRRIR